MKNKIQTLHPDPAKKGVRIDRDRYDQMSAAILACLKARGEATFNELRGLVEAELAGKFEGSLGWYYTTVKLDLEARGTLQRIPGSRPQRLRLVPGWEAKR